MKSPSIRDLFWLAVLCLVLGAWGWDRGRLVTRLEIFKPPVDDYDVADFGGGLLPVTRVP